MKKLLILVLALAIILLAGCGGTAVTEDPAAATEAAETPEQVPDTTPEPADLTISAAASLTDVLTEIGNDYMAEFTNVTLTFNFGSSGTLQTQIEEGAPADVFLSAAQKQMDALAEKDLIIADTRRNLLVNKVVLIVPANSDKGITSFEDVATDKVTVAAIGGENVPVGDYAREVFTTLGTLDTVLAKASLGSDVRQVLSWVESGDADCGIVYATDAATTGGVTIVAEAPEGSHKAIVYPGAVIADSANADAAQAFLDYLSSPAAAAKFEAAGFTIAG
jgi:molybdate transport system substrate-binding protein